MLIIRTQNHWIKKTKQPNQPDTLHLRLPVHFELAARRALRHSPLRLGLSDLRAVFSHGLHGLFRVTPPGHHSKPGISGDFWGSSPTILLDKIPSRFIKRSDSPSKIRSTGIPDLSYPQKKPSGPTKANFFQHAESVWNAS